MSNKRILIVDDKCELRELVWMTLDYGIYELHEAKCGKSSLALAKKIQPDLVILDVMMPGDFDGYQVCEELKKSSHGKIPHVMLLTARGQMVDFEKGVRVGADDYIIKPFRPSELINLVKQALV
jgi:two-component system phosphate regulon response regulator PhoB